MNPTEITAWIDYYDPSDGLTKQLLFEFQLDHVPSESEVITLAYNEALYVLDEYKFKNLGITAVGDLIDTSSVGWFIGDIP